MFSEQESIEFKSEWAELQLLPQASEEEIDFYLAEIKKYIQNVLDISPDEILEPKVTLLNSDGNLKGFFSLDDYANDIIGWINEFQKNNKGYLRKIKNYFQSNKKNFLQQINLHVENFFKITNKRKEKFNLLPRISTDDLAELEKIAAGKNDDQSESFPIILDNSHNEDGNFEENLESEDRFRENLESQFDESSQEPLENFEIIDNYIDLKYDFYMAKRKLESLPSSYGEILNARKREYDALENFSQEIAQEIDFSLRERDFPNSLIKRFINALNTFEESLNQQLKADNLLEVKEEQAQEPQAQEPQAQEPQAQEPQAQEPQAQEPQAQDIFEKRKKTLEASRFNRYKKLYHHFFKLYSEAETNHAYFNEFHKFSDDIDLIISELEDLNHENKSELIQDFNDLKSKMISPAEELFKTQKRKNIKDVSVDHPLPLNISTYGKFQAFSEPKEFKEFISKTPPKNYLKGKMISKETKQNWTGEKHLIYGIENNEEKENTIIHEILPKKEENYKIEILDLPEGISDRGLLFQYLQNKFKCDESIKEAIYNELPSVLSTADLEEFTQKHAISMTQKKMQYFLKEYLHDHRMQSFRLKSKFLSVKLPNIKVFEQASKFIDHLLRNGRCPIKISRGNPELLMALKLSIFKYDLIAGYPALSNQIIIAPDIKITNEQYAAMREKEIYNAKFSDYVFNIRKTYQIKPSVTQDTLLKMHQAVEPNPDGFFFIQQRKKAAVKMLDDMHSKEQEYCQIRVKCN